MDMKQRLELQKAYQMGRDDCDELWLDGWRTCADWILEQMNNVEEGGKPELPDHVVAQMNMCEGCGE